MTQELTRKRATVSQKAHALAKAPLHQIALATILILSAFLNLFRLTSQGYGNTYYAAAVKDMLTSWHNFFFVSFDAGFVTVDKPPLGLWIQAASAKLFGFNGLSLLLPQALAGILSVALLYHLVRKTFGPVAGLLAALVLAVTPIAVAINRTNDLDSLLVLMVLVGAWAVTRAVETGRLRWLIIGTAVVGLGFNVKMLEAYLVLPAFYLLYLLAAPVIWWRRFVHLGVATVVLVAVSLSWAVVVDLTPTDQRPYVGSSFNNSELDLAFGYNGAARLLGMGAGVPGGGAQFAQEASAMQENAQGEYSEGGGFGRFGAREVGEPGPLRLLDEQLAGQIGWLLPLAVVGLLAAGWQRGRPRLPLNQRQGALVLWGMWLLTMGIFFSIAGRFNAYYMVMLAPAVAALVGVGVIALWSDYRSQGRRGWLLPLSLLGMAALQIYIILSYYDEDWSLWLALVIMGLCLVAAAGLVFMRLRPRLKASAYTVGAMAIGILAILIAPTAWAAYTTWQGSGGMLPTAGPQTVQGMFGGGFLGSELFGGPGSAALMNTVDPALLDYLLENQGDADYLVADQIAFSAAPIILNTDKPVISSGGFMGRDPVFTTNELAALVHKGAVRFFLIPDRERIMEMMSEMMSSYGSSQQANQQSSPQNPPADVGDFLQTETTSWVQDNCQQIPQELWQSSNSEQEGGWERLMSAQALYDCGKEGS
ncbi:MAG TPA: glycosyltransferase family 39 protein [Rubrobacteraceae bacterium]|nr:glycosyltransferase family 39 protein [Rubrobacteraceae bacterium]